MMLLVGIGALLISAVFMLIYFTSKRLWIDIESGGGLRIGVRVKPSLIGPVIVNIEHGLEAVQIINALIAKYLGATRSSKES
jgi:hypothetical protein